MCGAYICRHATARFQFAHCQLPAVLGEPCSVGRALRANFTTSCLCRPPQFCIGCCQNGTETDVLQVCKAWSAQKWPKKLEHDSASTDTYLAAQCLVCAAGALVDSDSGAEDEDGFSEPPMIAGLGSLGCANGSLCVSASFISHEVGW